MCSASRVLPPVLIICFSLARGTSADFTPPLLDAPPLRARTQGGRWQLGSGQLELQGATRLEIPQGWLEGQGFWLDLKTRQARGERIVGFYPFPPRQLDPQALLDPRDIPKGLMVQATQAEMVDGRVLLTDARATTCEEARPHYWLSFRRLALLPDDRVKVERPALWVRGKRWLALPGFTFQPAKGGGGEGNLLPHLGHNQRDGLFIQWEHRLLGLGSASSLRWRVAQRGGLTGEWSWQRDLGLGSATVRLSHKERLTDDIDTRVRLSRTPEVRWSSAEWPLWGGRVSWRGEVEGGHYTEQPQRASAWRWGWRSELRAGIGCWGGWELHTGVDYRQAWYSGNREFSVLGLGVSADRQFRQRASLQFDYWQWREAGETPFFFDDLDFVRELRSAIRWRWGRSLLVGWEGRYELQHDRFERCDFLFLRRYHGLEFGLRWRTGRWKGVTLTGGLVGF